MGFGCKLKMIRWVLPSLHSSFTSHSSMRGKDLDFGVAKLPLLMTNFDETEMVLKDSLRLHACSSSAIQTMEDNYASLELIISKRSHKDLRNMIEDIQVPSDKDTSAFVRSVQACSSSNFHLLMENINMLENTFSDLDIMKLERDILLQLERLGALELFRACLSRTLQDSTVTHMSNHKSQLLGYQQEDKKAKTDLAKMVVHSKRKEERKSKHQKRLQATNRSCACRSETSIEKVMNTVVPSVTKKTKETRRLEFAKNEAELAKGIKVVAKLEKVKVALEKDYGRAVTLRCWAEAAGIDEKMLYNDLQFGWYCRNELLKSARSLVLYLARNYRGLGVAHEDLIQAGNIGLLQGAERFDHTKGYQFSTYVQYWIRKAMSQLVSRHGRGIKVPLALSTAMNRVQKARKTLKRSRGKHPNDVEVANFTGLSVDKITSADKCLRIVGSLDQKVGNFIDMKYLVATRPCY